MSCITIDKNKCKSCYLCIDACPKHLIKKGDFVGQNGDLTVEFDDKNSSCLGCGICATVCPDIAIVKVIKDE